MVVTKMIDLIASVTHDDQCIHDDMGAIDIDDGPA